MLKSSLGRLRIVGYAEGVSYLLFGITMPLKYMYEIPGPNKIIGMIHGLLFVLYTLMLIQVKIELRWGFMKTFLAFIASLLPFGTFIADKKLMRS